MLTFPCMNIIINNTLGIKEYNEDTLYWVLNNWSFINKLPQATQDCCYDAINQEHIDLDMSLALCTLNSHLCLFIFEKDGDLFINIKKKVYESLLEIEVIKKHLLCGGITKLSFSLLKNSKELEDEDERLNLRTFLVNCQTSLKSVNIRKYDPYYEKTINIIYENLVVCRQINSFYGYVSTRCMCKYILKIDFHDLETSFCLNTLVEDRSELLQLRIKEFRKIILSSNPPWTKVTNIHVKPGIYDSIIILSFIILKDLISFNNKDPFRRGSRFFHNEEVLNDLAKTSFQNRLKTVNCENFELCLNHNFLAKEVSFYIDISYPHNSFPLLSMHDRILNKDSPIYKHIVTLNIDLDISNKNNLNTMIHIVSNSSYLKQLNLYLISSPPNDFDPPIYSRILHSLMIDYRLCSDYFSTNQYMFTVYPFINKLSMIIYGHELNIENHNTAWTTNLPDLKCLESINIVIKGRILVEERLLTAMVNLSTLVNKHSMLIYSVEWCRSLRFHHILRHNGWIIVPVNNVP